MDLLMTRTCSAAPVQYQGTVNGRPFYFRARWDSWSFAIAASLDEAVVASAEAPKIFYRESSYGSGEWAASYMPHDEAEHLIRQCAMEYLHEQHDPG